MSHDNTAISAFELPPVLQADFENSPNYTSNLLEKEKLDEDKERIIKWSAASLYSGEFCGCSML